jgi:hypothetical protein
MDPPRVQVTAAFAVPGFVVGPTFQVQGNRMTASASAILAHDAIG